LKTRPQITEVVYCYRITSKCAKTEYTLTVNSSDTGVKQLISLNSDQSS